MKENSLKLFNSTKKVNLATHIKPCFDFFARSKGLLGCDHLEDGHGVWIKPCQSIHTFFMRIPIDVLFVDKSLHVVALKKQVPAWRLAGPYFCAHSVFELKAGTISDANVTIGDQLVCGS